MSNKIDCTQVLNFKNEFLRMCKSYQNPDDVSDCGECPVKETCICEIDDITQEHVDAVQKWSDEHPMETMLEHVKKLLPDIALSERGLPKMCPHLLGFKRGKCGGTTCTECWNRPYEEN